MKLCDQLTDYVNAAFTGLWVQSHEPDEAEKEIIQHAKTKDWKVAVWDVANGLRFPNSKSSGSTEVGGGDPLAVLRSLPALASENGTALLVLHNFHRFMSNPEVVQTAFSQLVEECRKHGPLYEQNPKVVAHVSRTSKWLLNAITKLKTELEPPKETS